MNRGSAKAMLTAGSVCIDAETKDMLNAASGNGVEFGGGSVMVWGIMGKVKTNLVVVQGNLNAQRYVNLLNNNLLPFMQNFSLTFQRQSPYCFRNCKLSGTKQRERLTLPGFIPGYESYRAHLG